MTVTIIGAGLAGLLAANMLRHRQASIVEKQAELPNNHSAILRFRSPVVGDVTGVPFRRVSMIKATAPWKNPVADALAYSLKNTGRLTSDRSINAGSVIAERFIAPPNLIERLARNVRVHYETTASFFPETGRPFISTMPMPALMEALDYPHRPGVDFTWAPGVNIKATLPDCDAYVSLLVPDPGLSFSRISITGNELIIECPMTTKGAVEFSLHTILADAMGLLGLTPFRAEGVKVYESRYAKITPIQEDARRQFMFWATDQHNVFSMGRFATWRPGLMLDDLVQDVRRIDGWLNDRYDIRRNR